MRIVRKYIGVLNKAPDYARRAVPVSLSPSHREPWDGYVGFLEIAVNDRVFFIHHAIHEFEANAFRGNIVSIIDKALKQKALEAIWDEFFA